MNAEPTARNELRILIINLISTWYMVGLIWLIQIVHYPLFELVGPENYQQYQANHQAWITPIVGIPMLVELMTAFLLLTYCPVTVKKWTVYAAFGLLVLVWISTAFIQVPCHTKLSTGFDADVHAWLVNSNWVRTIGWTARGLLVSWMLVAVCPKQLN